MARPKIQIDPILVEKLASIQCTMIEIAAVVGCSVDTLERRFADVIARAREKGKTSLRRMQWKSADEGSVPMQIWLGRNILGQSDKKESDIYLSATVSQPLTEDERMRLVQEVREFKK